MKHKTLLRILLLIFIIIFVISFLVLRNGYKDEKENRDEYYDLRDKVIGRNFKIDWDYLESINPDIIGWIYIDDTNINYPILKDDGSQFYLYHSFNRDRNSNGSIFTFESNFENDETIIYGHNMRNSNMFSDLKNFMNESFFSNHKTIKIYTKNQNYEANIFSVYSEDVYKEKDDVDDLNFKNKLEYYKNASIYSVNSEDEIQNLIKLVTCSYDGVTSLPTNQRYFIVANLIRKEK